ncbi:MAG: thioredoxin [Clostridiales bacterium]|nr:thioredoxin [Clostridiales bacterium]
MEIINVMSEAEFDEILKGEKPVLVDFWATWCNPCKMFAPILHEFKEEIGDKVEVVKVDVDQLPSLAYRYKIMSIPTVLVFKNGERVEKSVGLNSKAGLSEMVIKYI